MSRNYFNPSGGQRRNVDSFDESRGRLQNPPNRRRYRSGGRYSNRHSQEQMGGGQSNQSKATHSQHQPSRRSNSEGRPPSVNPTLDFNFLKDYESIHYINSSRIMFVMRGLPGSGKSTLAHAIQAKYNRVKLISTDDFFINQGMYRFDPSQLPAAHEWCKQQVTRACEGNRFNILIVDNTNIKHWEMEYYFSLADMTNFVVIVVEPKTSWRRNIEELKRKNIHNVPCHTLRRKLEEYEDVFPKYFAWFLNEADSATLYSIAQTYFEECLRNADFKRDFRTSSPNLKGIKSYFSKTNLDDSQKIFHCTASYTGDEVEDGYASRKSVLNAYGKVFTVHVIGFVITPRTFGARIKLSEECLKLWNQKDTDAGELHSVESLIPSLSNMQLNQSNVNRAVVNGNGYSKKRNVHNTNTIPTLHWTQHINNDKRFCPSYGKGSRAHFTLGCALNIPNVQTGYDLVNIIRLERQLGNRTPSSSFHVQSGIASNHGRGQWVIYLDRQIEMKAVFASSY